MYDEQTTMNPATKMRQRLRKCVLLALVLPGVSPISRAQSPKPLLLRDPAVSKSQVSFSYAGSIWVVNRDDGNVRRLIGGEHEEKPPFSRDCSLSAFTDGYDGTYADYVFSAVGVERR